MTETEAGASVISCWYLLAPVTVVISVLTRPSMLSSGGGADSPCPSAAARNSTIKIGNRLDPNAIIASREPSNIDE